MTFQQIEVSRKISEQLNMLLSMNGMLSIWAAKAIQCRLRAANAVEHLLC